MNPIDRPRISPADSTSRDLLDALTEMHSPRNAEVVLRTRRQVMDTARRMQASRTTNRQRLGVVMLAFGLLALLLTPALWSFSEALFGSEALSESTAFSLVLFVMLFSTLIAVVMLQGREKRGRRSSL